MLINGVFWLQNNMVIGIDASRANFPYKTGVEWYSFYLICALAKIDSENTYLLYTDKPLEGDLADLVIRHPNFQEKVLTWPFKIFWTIGRMSFEMFWHKPEILFVPANTLPFFTPKKTITTIHDIAFKREERVYVGIEKNKKMPLAYRFLRSLLRYYLFLKTGKLDLSQANFLDWSTRQALRRAKIVLTVSEFTKHELMAVYGVDPKNIQVIYNGISEIYYPQATDLEILNSYGIEPPYLLFVGRLERKKNIPLLIEAFALLKEAPYNLPHKLVLIGSPGYGYDEIKYIIEEYNLGEQIDIPGWVAEADLPIIYAGAEAFVFPSRHEGFGIPVAQALAMGIPAVVSDIEPLREVAGGCALYFDKDSKEDAAEKINIILKDQGLRQRMIADGMSKVKHYNWDKSAVQILDIFKKL